SLPPPEKLSFQQQHVGSWQLRRNADRCRMQPLHERGQQLIVARCQIAICHVPSLPPTPRAVSKSRSRARARDSSTLTLLRPTRSESAISSCVSPSTYASHSSAR